MFLDPQSLEFAMPFEIVTAVIGGGATIVGSVLGAVLGTQRERKRTKTEIEGLQQTVKETAGLPEGAPGEFATEAAYIRSIRLYRKDYRIRLWFRPSSKGDTLTFDKELSYEVVNVSDAAVRFIHRLEVIPTAQFPERILSVGATGADLAGQEYLEQFPDSGAPKLTFQRELTIRPNQMDPRLRIEGTTRKFADTSGHDIIYLPDPTLFAEVRVESVPENVEVEVHFGHRQYHDMEAVPKVNPTLWRLRKGFLPWSSIYIIWIMKNPAGASHAGQGG